jgi:hypothetical protein
VMISYTTQHYINSVFCHIYFISKKIIGLLTALCLGPT